jgi:lipopolysaccharide heptosyltransferase I
MRVPRSILVVRLTSLGDVLLATPAVQAIRAGFPDASISWLVEGSVAGLLAHQKFVDRVIEFPRRELERSLRSGRVIRAASVFSAFHKRLVGERYDIILDMHGIAKSALFVRMARADRRIGFDGTFAKEASWTAYGERIRSENRRMHKVERNMLFASHLGIGATGSTELTASSEGDLYVDEYLRRDRIALPLIAVNPFSSKGSEFKRWGLPNYGELIRRVGEQTGATTVILWGPGEELEARTLLEMSGDRAALACPTTVSQLLSLLKRAELYVGGDTGVMHLAALAGTPVVAIFGPTDHLINGPYGERNTVITSKHPCSPCRDKKCKSRECVRSISVDDVYQAAMKAWERRGAGRAEGE